MTGRKVGLHCCRHWRFSYSWTSPHTTDHLQISPFIISYNIESKIKLLYSTISLSKSSSHARILLISLISSRWMLLLFALFETPRIWNEIRCKFFSLPFTLCSVFSSENVSIWFFGPLGPIGHSKRLIILPQRCADGSQTHIIVLRSTLVKSEIQQDGYICMIVQLPPTNEESYIICWRCLCWSKFYLDLSSNNLPVFLGVYPLVSTMIKLEFAILVSFLCQCFQIFGVFWRL